MIQLVYRILEPLNLPLAWQLRPPIDSKQIVLSYHFFNESDFSYEDGNPTEDTGSLQVDIFSEIDYTGIMKQIKKLLREAGFIFSHSNPDTLEELDENTVLYHKVLIFNYIESEVLKEWEKP